MNRRLSPNAQGVALMTGGSLAYVINDGLVREATERDSTCISRCSFAGA